MNKFSVLASENSVSGEQVQDAAEGNGVGAGRFGESGRGGGFVAEAIRDSEIGDNLKASRKEVRGRDLCQNLLRRRLGH